MWGEGQPAQRQEQGDHEDAILGLLRGSCVVTDLHSAWHLGDIQKYEGLGLERGAGMGEADERRTMKWPRGGPRGLCVGGSFT